MKKGTYSWHQDRDKTKEKQKRKNKHQNTLILNAFTR